MKFLNAFLAFSLLFLIFSFVKIFPAQAQPNKTILGNSGYSILLPPEYYMTDLSALAQPRKTYSYRFDPVTPDSINFSQIFINFLPTKMVDVTSYPTGHDVHFTDTILGQTVSVLERNTSVPHYRVRQAYVDLENGGLIEIFCRGKDAEEVKKLFIIAKTISKN